VAGIEPFILTASPRTEIEWILSATAEYPNAYTDIDVWADFTHSSGVMLRRPAFWDGGQLITADEKMARPGKSLLEAVCFASAASAIPSPAWERSPLPPHAGKSNNLW
jgi:hypothetical protein